jgi:hypothetical protein
VQVQVEEGKASVRCPGFGCSYRLLPEDLSMVAARVPEVSGSVARLNASRGQNGELRLKEIVDSAFRDQSVSWLLQQSQPCPRCLVLANRDTGCDHIVCRCGSNFCFRCGGSYDANECVCRHLRRHRGRVAFAAWLRFADTSPCAWLWETQPQPEAEATWVLVVDWLRPAGEHPAPLQNSKHFINTLGFWLWIAGLPMQLPSKWEDVAQSQQPQGATGVLSSIAPIVWSKDDEQDTFFWEDEFWEHEVWEHEHELWDYRDFTEFLMEAYDAKEPARAKRRQPAALFGSYKGSKQAWCRAVEAKDGTKHGKEPRRSSVRSGAFSP